MPDRPFISHFSPQRTEAELLEEIHVQRHELLAEAVSTMRDSVLSGNKHHLLFIGPRGAGKTHLVRLIHHRLGKQTDLADKMRFAWLNEDETATSFLKLLILIYRDVSQRYPQDFPASDLQSIFGLDADTARERLGERLLKNLGSRTLVVLMENLDSLFKHMPEGEQRIWRAFVQNHPVFATVGTAQSLFDGVADRKQPFFGFFDTRHLTPLDVADATLLLKKIAHLNGQPDLVAFLDTSTGHARVKAIHDLAGGNPRIYLIFSDFLTPESLDDLVRPFEEIADRQLTSYYQERLRWLSPQQQEIIQFLCHQRGGVPVKNIAEGLFTTHNSITGQLRQLGEYRYLKSTKVGREVLYELAEPLMRLALQIKDTHDKKPLMLIVDFLRVWYEREEIVQHLGKLSPSDAARAYFEEALRLIDSDEPNLRHEIFRKMVSDFDPVKCDEVQLAALRTLAKETNDTVDWAQLGAALLFKREGHEEELMNILSRLIVDNSLPDSVRRGVLFSRGEIYFRAKAWSAALDDINAAIQLGMHSRDILQAELFYMRGIVRRENKCFDEAVFDLESAIESAPIEPSTLMKTLSALGEIEIRRGRRDRATTHYERLLAIEDLPPHYKFGAALVLTAAKNGGNERLQGYEEVASLYGQIGESLPPEAEAETVLCEGAIVSLALHDEPVEAWQNWVPLIVTRFAQNGLLNALAAALLKSLDEGVTDVVARLGYEKWLQAWRDAFSSLNESDKPKVEVPFRLYEIGLKYIETDDEAILLTLPIEERRILRSVLELPPEKAA